ncbi:MAG: DEAD/DEAH box helicase [Methylococcaceae bacterium]|nr:MAG: DEAD/DEAH box helicase [Methylococcaceae bacterium]
MPFTQLGLSAELLRAVSEEGYSKPTPIQQQAIPVVLEGRDILAGAQTGTGKTASFTLPTLQRLMETPINSGRQRVVRALVLTPTRELAAQVHDSVRTYGRHLPLRSAVIFGGVSMVPQFRALRNGVDIVVATPGRLLDHLRQQTLDISQVEVFVLDEADRMLDMGFIRDIRQIMNMLPRARQNLLFSATITEEIKGLSAQLLHNPALVEVARQNQAADTVSQRVYAVEKDRKRELLSHLVGTGNWQQVLVFVRTKHGADRLANQLIRDGIESASLHGDKSQGARTRALADFKSGKVAVLVATDIAARGLDIDQLPHVVNFELPNVPEDYVHRIGRTGRAGANGEALSLVAQDEAKLLGAIEKVLKRDIPRATEPGFEPNFVLRSQPGYKAPHRGDGGHNRPAKANVRHAGNHGDPARRSARGRSSGDQRGNARAGRNS